MAQGFLQSYDGNIKVSSAGTKPASEINMKVFAVMKEVGDESELFKIGKIGIYNITLSGYNNK